MTIDLVIPTYKPGEKLFESLRRLSRQTVTFGTIFLINTEEEYFPEHLTEQYPNVAVKHIKKEEFDHGATRDYGASLSDAEIIAFMTDDAVPRDKYMVENLLKAFEDPRVGAAYGRQMADPKDNYLEYYTRSFNYPPDSSIKTKADLPKLGIKTFFCSNVCSAYRKKDYEAKGGFIHKTIFNEDMIMASRLIESDKAIAYQADAAVWHWHNYRCFDQLHRNFDLAVSQVSYGGLFLEVSSESEGMRMVLHTLKHLLFTGRFFKIPKFMADTACKFIGYKLGSNYKKLPKSLILKLTMNHSYWDSYEKL